MLRLAVAFAAPQPVAAALLRPSADDPRVSVSVKVLQEDDSGKQPAALAAPANSVGLLGFHAADFQSRFPGCDCSKCGEDFPVDFCGPDWHSTVALKPTMFYPPVNPTTKLFFGPLTPISPNSSPPLNPNAKIMFECHQENV